MLKTDLRMGQVWKSPDGVLKTIVHLAVIGVGDSVAWELPDGSRAGGSAEEFMRVNEPVDTSNLGRAKS